MVGPRGSSAGVGGYEWRRMEFANDVYCIANLVDNGFCMGFIHAFLDESKGKKGQIEILSTFHRTLFFVNLCLFSCDIEFFQRIPNTMF